MNQNWHVLRLNPQEDIRTTLENWCKDHKIKAASLVSSVGSLSQIKIRLANSNQFYNSNEPHEIISLNGLISEQGVHLHISVADSKGHVRGGHVVVGNTIHTTLELVIVELLNFEFQRIKDPQTGYPELLVRKS